MKLKNIFSHNNNRQIWRILVSETDKVVIEERDSTSNEAFYNVIDLLSEEKIINDYQFKEIKWMGIEAVYEDKIFFHAYVKPDLPIHNGIIAFDIASGKIIWQNDLYIFYFAYNNKIYCYKEEFEGRSYFSLDINTGQVIESFSNDTNTINLLKSEWIRKQNSAGFIFPEAVESFEDIQIKNIVDNLTEKSKLSGKYEYILNKSVLFLSYHNKNADDTFNNNFFIIDINTKKTIFAEAIGTRLNNYLFDSFFIKNKYLFVLKEKNQLNGFFLD